MVYFVGDEDWTRKVKPLINFDVGQDVYVIQLDREGTPGNGYSSASSVQEASRIAETTDSTIVLVGSCPESDYRVSNGSLWDTLPSDRTFFFDSTQGASKFRELMTSIGAQ